MATTRQEPPATHIYLRTGLADGFLAAILHAFARVKSRALDAGRPGRRTKLFPIHPDPLRKEAPNART